LGMLKRIIKVPFRMMGYDIIRRRKSNDIIFQELGIRTLLDIGANVGQYATEARNIFKDAYIYSFEPLKDCYEELRMNMNGDIKFQAINVALGDKTGEARINHNQHSPASSLLQLCDLHCQHFAFAVDTKPETVRIERLDDLAKALKLEVPLMIKIDVQGFEDKVISGGQETIKKAKVLVIETSFEKLYDGQVLFDDIYQKVKELGFVYRSNNHHVRSAKDGRVLQENSIFMKADRF